MLNRVWSGDIHSIFRVDSIEHLDDSLTVGFDLDNRLRPQHRIVLNHRIHRGNGAMTAEVHLALRRIVGQLAVGYI